MLKRKITVCVVIFIIAISVCACSKKASRVDNSTESVLEISTTEVPTTETLTAEKDEDISIGDYITFGTYEQDNDTYNGKEAIEWIVLDIKDGKMLVISRCGLDFQRYNEEGTDNEWEVCTLRKWLNRTFFNSAFSEEEQNMIPTVVVPAHRNPTHNTYPGNSVEDKIFLLSIQEANMYFEYDEDRMCETTFYTYDICGDKYCQWWLRSQGNVGGRAAVVNTMGKIDEYGKNCDKRYGEEQVVRPAMWNNLNS